MTFLRILLNYRIDTRWKTAEIPKKYILDKKRCFTRPWPLQNDLDRSSSNISLCFYNFSDICSILFQDCWNHTLFLSCKRDITDPIFKTKSEYCKWSLYVKCKYVYYLHLHKYNSSCYKQFEMFLQNVTICLCHNFVFTN
jgi:hypothetical protein